MSYIIIAILVFLLISEVKHSGNLEKEVAITNSKYKHYLKAHGQLVRKVSELEIENKSLKINREKKVIK